MAWRIVKQPNEKFARFSDIVDDFTHMNMTKEEATTVCVGYAGIVTAMRKVKGGELDFKPWTINTVGSGQDRWEHAIDQILMVHGEQRVKEILEGINE